MKILFEEYQYNTEDVKGILGNFVLSGLDLDRNTQQLRYVGYFYNSEIENNDGTKGDLVFILPKVLLNEEGLAFGIDPKQLMHFNWEDWKKDEKVVESGTLSKRQVYDFIYGFSTWIYRAVDIYRANQKRNPKQEDLEANVMTSVQIGHSGKKENATFMDVLLSLLDFQKTHQGFITFVMKMAHSGFNKVSWPKTIARTTAIFQDDVPIYLNPINKKREVNFDEELLIIYYSILNYMHEEYGFPIPNQPGYKLIKGAMFQSYIKIQGKTRLHKIRYKYYSDSAVLLWNLCYAFFDKIDNLKAQTNRKDYLLVNSFHYVFEAMIDELIGEKDLPKHLKNSEDDKRIDHLYTYKYLVENLDKVQDISLNHEIYSIADSKYYRRDEKLRGHDVPKQFTYARNVTQWHMDLLHDILHDKPESAEKYKAIPLFDKITEGYNIIPNFFVSAKVEDDLNYAHDSFGPTKMNDDKFVHESFHFWDRLFDRDTLFTLHYDVNFLYVLKLFAQNKNHDKIVWREEVRDKFRKHILKHLNDSYDFYQVLLPESCVDEFVETYYRKIVGKVFSFEDILQDRVLIYAERKTQPEGNGNSCDQTAEAYVDTDAMTLVIPTRGSEKLYRVVKVRLGEDYYRSASRRVYVPKLEYKIIQKENREYKLAPVSEEVNSFVNIPREEYALVGYYRSIEQLNWIRTNAKYNIRAQRRSKNVKLNEAEMNANYLILHNEEFGTYVYRIKTASPYLLAKEEMPQSDGYTPGHEFYMIYDLDTKSDSIQALDILVQTQKFIDYTASKKPRAFKLSALREKAKVVSLPQLKYSFEDEETFLSLAADDSVIM